MSTYFNNLFRQFRRKKKNDFEKDSAFPKIIGRYDLLVLFNPDIEIDSDIEESDDNRINHIIEDLRDNIENEFSIYVADLFSNKVVVEIKNLRRGSIVATIFLVGYGLIAQYHDVVESLTLVRQQLESITHRAVRRHGIRNRDYRVNVALRNIPHELDIQNDNRSERYSVYSSVFFWYLLLMNIFLIAVIAYLVYQAVIFTYFTSH